MLEKSCYITIAISIIGLFQIWYIWFRVIFIRTCILDYHKYGMNKIFDNDGNEITSEEQRSNYLLEYTYANVRKTRTDVNTIMSEKWERKPSKFRNFRMTRVKLDIMLPIFFTLIWLLFIFYECLIIIK